MCRAGKPHTTGVLQNIRHDEEPTKGNAMPREQINAVVVTERQAEVIFAALDHCRTVIAKEPGDEQSEYELTEVMRLFTWRD
jgi:hypothetical protein